MCHRPHDRVAHSICVIFGLILPGRRKVLRETTNLTWQQNLRLVPHDRLSKSQNSTPCDTSNQRDFLALASLHWLGMGMMYRFTPSHFPISLDATLLRPDSPTPLTSQANQTTCDSSLSVYHAWLLRWLFGATSRTLATYSDRYSGVLGSHHIPGDLAVREPLHTHVYVGHIIRTVIGLCYLLPDGVSACPSS